MFARLPRKLVSETSLEVTTVALYDGLIVTTFMQLIGIAVESQTCYERWIVFEAFHQAESVISISHIRSSKTTNISVWILLTVQMLLLMHVA
jgi:hypothetical protein